MSFFSYQNYLEQVKLNKSIFFLLITLSFLASIFLSRMIYRLEKEKESKTANIIVTSIGALLCLLLLALKDMNLFVWNELYLTAPILISAIIVLFGTLLTESRKNVLVYASLGNFEFVKGKQNSSRPSPENDLQE